LAKHAQHVVLIHFPIGLFLAAVAFQGIRAGSEEVVSFVIPFRFPDGAIHLRLGQR
jgi:uncharacterized membrane protein